MRRKLEVDDLSQPRTGQTHRERLLSGLPVTEQHLQLAGISTSVLVGGDGPPLVLLHGPGESAIAWMRVIPDLVTTHRVIAPDLPGHGGSRCESDDRLNAERVLVWLDELIDRTCSTRPVLMGHVLGGAIAARFSLEHDNRVEQLVLVDSLGLARFRPALRFALTMIGFLARPTERSYYRFMRQCSFDVDRLREEMGERWKPFAAYNVALARSPSAKQAGLLMRTVGLPRIPPEDLDRISVPTTLIWGRHDRANRLRVAERASERHGWPLHVIENCADDPPRDQPQAFLRALHAVLGQSTERKLAG